MVHTRYGCVCDNEHTTAKHGNAAYLESNYKLRKIREFTIYLHLILLLRPSLSFLK